MDFLLSHRLPISCAKPFFSDPSPRSSAFDYSLGNALPLPPVSHLAGLRKTQQADVDPHTFLRDPPPLFASFGERPHSVSHQQPISKNTRLSSRPLSLIDRKDSGKKTPASEIVAKQSSGEQKPIMIRTKQSQSKQKMETLKPLVSSLTSRPSQLAQKLKANGKPSIGSRFSFFSRNVPVQEESPDTSDEKLGDLNIHTALFPYGHTDDNLPVALSDLTQNATGLLSKFQTAYKGCTRSLKDLTIENETLVEELEGCRMRTRHLKLQLDNMTTKVAEQDKLIMELVDGLAHEKHLRQQEQRAAEKPVMPMTKSRAAIKNGAGKSKMQDARRGSKNSVRSLVIDSGFESDEDSPSSKDSSRSQFTPSSPVSTSSGSTTSSRHMTVFTTSPPSSISASPTSSSPATVAPPSSPPKMALLEPSSYRQWQLSASSPYVSAQTSCANCHGRSASEAWNLVNMLNEQNLRLKDSMADLTYELDGSLEDITWMLESKTKLGRLY